MVMVMRHVTCWCRCNHIGSLVALHVRGERGRSIVAPIANGALEWFPMIMCFEMDFEVIASRKGTGTMLALISLVASVQFNMPISASLVLEGSITIIACVNCILIVMVIQMVAAMIELLVHQSGRGTC